MSSDRLRLLVVADDPDLRGPPSQPDRRPSGRRLL